MKTRKIFAAIFALLALTAAVGGVYLSLKNMDAQPVLLQAPEEARQRAVALMDAVCTGEYDRIAQQLYGQPELGLDREPADEVGRLFWEAMEESRSYTITRDCYATATGIAMDVKLECLDIASVTANLRQRAQTLLEERVARAEDTSEIYEEGGEYREDFVMEVLKDAAEAALEEDGKTIHWELTLQFVYDGGRWWIRPDDALLTAVSGGAG